MARADLEPSPELPRRIRQWHDNAKAMGGYAVVESAPLSMPGREKLPWSAAEPPPLMKAIRTSRDPKGLFARGRMPV